MNTVTWLHLSDLHFQVGDRFNRQVVLILLPRFYSQVTVLANLSPSRSLRRLAGRETSI